jgi:hypothetical protein
MSDPFSELTSGLGNSLSDTELHLLELLDIQRSHAEQLIASGVVARAILHSKNPPQSRALRICVYRRQHMPVIRDGKAITDFLEIGGIRFVNELDSADVVDVDVYRRRGSEDAPLLLADRFLHEEAQQVANMAADLAFRDAMGELPLTNDLTALREQQPTFDGR